MVLNIAEGSARKNDKDFARFLNIADASAHECVACLDIAIKKAYIHQETHKEFCNLFEDLSNQLTAFQKSIFK